MRPDSRTRRLALAAFAAIAGLLIGLGYWHYRSEREGITREECQTLAAIGELKAKQIQQWRKERVAEVERAAKDSLTSNTVSGVLKDPSNQTYRSDLQECLREEVTGQDSSASLIFDAGGNLLASTGTADEPVEPATRKALHEAITSKKSVVSDFFPTSDGVQIDFAAPVLNDLGELQAVLVLRHKAEYFLYPLLLNWPTPSHSAETLLVQREGNEVVFLSKLRHRSDPPLTLRIPLTDSQVPAVQAVLGKSGIFEGVDYRGVQVVCALLSVPGSPWFLTAEVDAEEIFSDAGYRAVVTAVIVTLLILLAAGMVAFFYRQRQTRILNNLVKAERQKTEAQERELRVAQQHRTILQTAMDGFFILDTQGRIREVNEAYCRMTGYSELELLSMGIADLEADESSEEIDSHMQKIVGQGQDRFESRQRAKDGTVIEVEVSVQFKQAEGVMVAFLRDITVPKRIQEELLENDRKLRESNARYDELARQIPVGIYALRVRRDGGAEFEYVSDKLCQMLECNDHEALRDPECVFGTIHPDDRPSLDEANRVAAQTLALFRWEGRARLWGKMGWVHIESEPSVFPDGSILWNGVVSDITERKMVAEALQASEERFSQLFKSMEEGFFLAELIFDTSGKPVDWRFLDVNPAYSKIMGMRRGEVIGRSVREIFPGIEDYWLDAHTRCALTGEPATVEGFIQETGRHYINHLHSPRHGQFACIFSDTTERKNAEMALRASEEQFRSMFESASIGMAQCDPLTGRWLRVNEKMCQITGYAQNEMLRLCVRDITHPEDREKDNEEFERVVRGELPSYRMEKRYVRKDGSEIWVNVNMTVIRGSDGSPYRTMATIEDITGRKAAEETSNRLAEIVNSSEDAIIGRNLEGRITSWNHGAEKIFGFSASDMVGSTMVRLIPAGQWQEEDEIMARIKRGESIMNLESERLGKDGRLLNVSITSSPIRDAGGTVIGISKVARDITARKQAEACRRIAPEILQGLLVSDDLQSSVRRIVATLKKETGLDAVGIRLQDGEDFPYACQDGFSSAFLRTENSLLARTPDGGVCRDKDGKVCLECTCGLVISGRTDPANPLFTRGGSCWTNDSLSLVGIPAGDDPRLHPRNKCIHNGYASVALIPIRTQERIIGLIQMNDHRRGRFSIETVEILEGVAGYIGETLMRKKSELERNEALLRAEEAAAAKNDFLGVMSHELRTPLNGVLGFTELLSDTPLNDEQRSYAQTIRNSGEHLLAIVNDILDFSSIEKGALAIHDEFFAVAELVKSSAQTLRKTATDKAVEFRSVIGNGVPAQISGDELRMRQILLNLLGNAVKFTSSGSVTLQVTTSLENGLEHLVFTVEDTGIGMSPETVSALFQPFTQAEMKVNRTFGGTGLGLAISQRLAQAMGGEITVASTPGKGSVFTFRLPLKVVSTGSTTGTPDSGVSGNRPSVLGAVLVVEDDQASGVLAVKMLQNLGYSAELVVNGADAVEAFVPGKFFHILMDIAMPVMDGLAAVRKIREIEMPTGHHVPITAFTANVMPGDRERCFAAGMDDFLAKPFNQGDLAAKLAFAKPGSSHRLA